MQHMFRQHSAVRRVTLNKTAQVQFGSYISHEADVAYTCEVISRSIKQITILHCYINVLCVSYKSYITVGTPAVTQLLYGASLACFLAGEHNLKRQAPNIESKQTLTGLQQAIV